MTMPEQDEQLRRWMTIQPYGGATEREQAAFIAGFQAATKPIPTAEQLQAKMVELLTSKLRDESVRKAALPIGTCPECEGEGELGGQFCGGHWKCEKCNGTGIVAP